MVEDRITDGKRIAQLLASEFTGLRDGPLADVVVVDADSEAVPSESGTTAYRIEHRARIVATVRLYPNFADLHVDLDLSEPLDDLVDVPDRLDVDGDDILRISSGAAVKPAVDVFRALLETVRA